MDCELIALIVIPIAGGAIALFFKVDKRIDSLESWAKLHSYRLEKLEEDSERRDSRIGQITSHHNTRPLRGGEERGEGQMSR